MFWRQCAPLMAEPVEPDYWEMTVTTPSASASWVVNIAAGTTPDITVDWGDSSSDTYTSTGLKSHTYTSAGTYTVRISGTFGALNGNIRLGSNSTNRPYLKAVQAVGGITNLVNFLSTFVGCTGLTSIPADLFRYNTTVSTSGFYGTFYSCTGITSIPTDLFRYNTAVSSNGFQQTFNGCTNLTSIPTDLFRYNTAVSTSGFQQTFNGCSGLTSIPTDLFRYNINVSSNGFYGTFNNCTGITSIPTDLFRYNTAVSTSGFFSTFSGCTGLTSIPTDLFRYNTAVSTDGFYQTFRGCTNLTTAPALLFKYNTACLLFQGVFENCNKLQLRADLFFDTGEASTRFLNQSVVFTSAMRIGTFTGTQGTAPALWTCDFGTGTPTTTTCFTGHTTSSVDNHADIPTAWGGP